MKRRKEGRWLADGWRCCDRMEGGFARRWELCWLMFGARGVCQANRVLLGALLPFISDEVKMSSAQKGSVLAAFSTGYMLTQVIGGRASDRFGGKKITQFAISTMALGSCLAPALLKKELHWFWLCYFIMGLAEGPSYPTTGSMLSKWIPSQERGAATSIVDTGTSVASMLTFALAPLLATRFGWRFAFRFFGSFSLFVCLLWALRASNRPAEDSLCTHEERRHLLDSGMNPDDILLINGNLDQESSLDLGSIDTNKTALHRTSFLSAASTINKHNTDKNGIKKKRSTSNRDKTFPWPLFCYSGAWAVVIAHASFNFGRYFVYNSIVSFYVERLGVSPVKAGQQVLLGQIADTLGKFIFAPSIDRAIKRDITKKTLVRKITSSTAFIVFALSMLAMASTNSLFLVSTALIICKVASSAHVCGFKTTYLDLTSKHTGTLSGVSNTVATLSAMISPLATGFLLESYHDRGWTFMFFLIAAVNILAALLWAFFASADSLDDKISDLKGAT